MPSNVPSDEGGTPFPGPRLAPPTSPEFNQSQVGQGVVNLLKQTKPWVRFLSVLGFVLCGFMVLAGVFSVFAGLTSGQGQMLAAGLLYVLMTILYFVPSMLLGQFATAIGKLGQSGTEDDLQEAMERQKSFWKFVGIMTLVVMGLYLLAIVAMFFFGAMAVL